MTAPSQRKIQEASGPPRYWTEICFGTWTSRLRRTGEAETFGRCSPAGAGPAVTLQSLHSKVVDGELVFVFGVSLTAPTVVGSAPLKADPTTVPKAQLARGVNL